MCEKIRVGVIGAGASGLAALRHLSKDLDTFMPVCYEKGDTVGGVWVYQESTDLDDDGFCNTLYRNMRTNLPKEVMDFPDFSYPSDLPSFLHHKHVKDYCQDYATQWNLLQFIKFRTRVVLVKPVEDTDPVMWTIDVEDLVTGELSSEQLDAVIVCNGHLSKPYIPELAGAELFQGRLIHSRQYRIPEDYKGQRVICVGGSFSGMDIMLDISTMADKVYLSHDKALSMEIPTNAEQVPRISSIGEKHVTLENGAELEVDAIIFCTGYRYDFSFLSPDCGVALRDERLSPLYKHIFNIRRPTMAFIGIPKRVLLYRCSYMQAQIVCGVLKGKYRLPPTKDMVEDEEREDRSLPANQSAHDLFGELEHIYYRDLRELFGIELWPKGVLAIYKRVTLELIGKDATFKDINFVLSSDKSSYKELPKGVSLTSFIDNEVFNGDIERS